MATLCAASDNLENRSLWPVRSPSRRSKSASPLAISKRPVENGEAGVDERGDVATAEAPAQLFVPVKTVQMPIFTMRRSSTACSAYGVLN